MLKCYSSDHVHYTLRNILKEATESTRRLEALAELSTNPRRVYDLYDEALSICRYHNFVNKAAIILCKRASYGLEHGMLADAMNDADNSITIDPEYLEVSLFGNYFKHSSECMCACVCVKRRSATVYMKLHCAHQRLLR